MDDRARGGGVEGRGGTGSLTAVGVGVLRVRRRALKSKGTKPVFQKPLRIFSGVKAISCASTYSL